MREYKILEGTAGDVQKILNQWRHPFDLDIKSMNTEKVDRTHTWVIILLTRTERPEVH